MNCVLSLKKHTTLDNPNTRATHGQRKKTKTLNQSYQALIVILTMNRSLLLEEIEVDSPSSIHDILAVKACSAAVFNSIGTLLFFSQMEIRVTVWNVKCKRVVKTLLVPLSENSLNTERRDGRILCLDLPFPKDGSKIMVAYKHKIALVDVTSETIITTVAFSVSLLRMTCHPKDTRAIVVVPEQKEPLMFFIRDGARGEYSCDDSLCSAEPWRWRTANLVGLVPGHNQPIVTEKLGSESHRTNRKGHKCESVPYFGIPYIGICYKKEFQCYSNKIFLKEFFEYDEPAIAPHFAVAFLNNGVLLRLGPTGRLKVFDINTITDRHDAVPNCIAELRIGRGGPPELSASVTNNVVGVNGGRKVTIFKENFFQDILIKASVSSTNIDSSPMKFNKFGSFRKRVINLKQTSRQAKQKSISSGSFLSLAFAANGSTCFGLYKDQQKSSLFCWDTLSKNRDFESQPWEIMKFICCHPTRPEFLTISFDGKVYWWKHPFVEHWPALCHGFRPKLTSSGFNETGHHRTSGTDDKRLFARALNDVAAFGLPQFAIYDGEDDESAALESYTLPFFLPCHPE